MPHLRDAGGEHHPAVLPGGRLTCAEIYGDEALELVLPRERPEEKIAGLCSAGRSTTRGRARHPAAPGGEALLRRSRSRQLIEIVES